MKPTIAEAAREELLEAGEYYEGVRQGLGGEFLDEFEKTLQNIILHPMAWKSLSPRTRCCLFHRFPYGVIYHAGENGLLVVSIMDLRRDPKRWEKHL